MNRKKLLGIILALAAAPALALIQPLRINFQGKLIDPSTNNPRTGPVTLIFNLYNVPTAGASLYTETQSMTVTNGVFSVEIGTITALSRELFLGASVYLGVTVQGDTEMLPRQNLVMSAYAFTANQLSDLNEVRLIAGPTYSTFTAAGNLDVPSGISASTKAHAAAAPLLSGVAKPFHPIAVASTAADASGSSRSRSLSLVRNRSRSAAPNPLNRSS